jgi:DNA repair protein RecN (Recombination protein N)
MLSRLEIQNYAIIKELMISFSKGLIILTGETGAGKSILLGALGLILGNRADTKVLFDKNEKCVVEGTFLLKDDSLQEYFEQSDLDYEQELIIRREINTAGKSRAFINDTPVRLNILQEISSQLVDLHQQFETIELQQKNKQFAILDGIADNKETLDTYVESYLEYKKLLSKLHALTAEEKNSIRELGFIQHQLDEFEQAGILPGEYEEINEKFALQSNAEQIKSVFQEAEYLLQTGEPSLTSKLNALALRLEQIEKYQVEIAEFKDRIARANIDLEEIARDMAQFGESIDYDQGQIRDLENRMSTYNKLFYKYQVETAEALLNIRFDFQSKLESIESLSESLQKLETDVEQKLEKLTELANVLSLNRKAKADSFESDVNNLLGELHMKNARLRIVIDSSENFNGRGKDEIDFLFAPNKGSEFLPIKKVASGGELSRLSLCIDSLVAQKVSFPTLIFDEIDIGVGGEVARKMGQMIRQLANHHQVIVITHAPQIASMADQHLKVSKRDTESRSLTNVSLLDGNDRILEIAKMLGGDPPSEAAIMNAKELLSV